MNNHPGESRELNIARDGVALGTGCALQPAKLETASAYPVASRQEDFQPRTTAGRKITAEIQYQATVLGLLQCSGTADIVRSARSSGKGPRSTLPQDLKMGWNAVNAIGCGNNSYCARGVGRRQSTVCNICDI